MADPITFVLPEGTTSITDGAFYNNKKLVKITLPTTLKRIGDIVFYGCSSLGEVEYNAIEVEDQSKRIFPESIWSITFGDKVRVIPAYLLDGCYGLDAINLPESLEVIGEHAFSGC